MAKDTAPTSSGMVLLAWLIVSLPLCWGVYRSALNVVKLFQPAPVAAANTPPPGPLAR